MKLKTCMCVYVICNLSAMNQTRVLDTLSDYHGKDNFKKNLI